MPFNPNLQIKNIFKRNVERLTEKRTAKKAGEQAQTIKESEKEYYKRIRLIEDKTKETVRSSKDVTDKDIHFFVNQRNKILEIKDLKIPASVEETIMVKYNSDLTRDHSKRVMELFLRNLRQEYGIDEKNIVDWDQSKGGIYLLGTDTQDAFERINKATNLKLIIKAVDNVIRSA